MTHVGNRTHQSAGLHCSSEQQTNMMWVGHYWWQHAEALQQDEG